MLLLTISFEYLMLVSIVEHLTQQHTITIKYIQMKQHFILVYEQEHYGSKIP